MTTEDAKPKKEAWFVGYLPYVDGDFDYDERARCLTRRFRHARQLTRRRIR